MLVERKIKVNGKRPIKSVIETYNNAWEVVRDCRERKITDDSFHDKSKEFFDEWEGVKNYDEALELLEKGYQPTVEKLKEKMKDLGKMGFQKRMRIENNVVGGAPVVPLAMMGLPKSMLDTKIKPIKCKVIDIYYDLTCSCGTSSEEIIKNGQKLLGAIMELESQGYKFNLYAVQTYSDDSSVDALVVKIKSSNQPLDLKRMSFPLTHTAFFRVIGFDWYSRCPKATYRSGYGRGLSYRLNKEQMAEFAKEAFGKNALFISGKDIMYEDEKYIKEVLHDFGNRKNR